MYRGSLSMSRMPTRLTWSKTARAANVSPVVSKNTSSVRMSSFFLLIAADNCAFCRCHSPCHSISLKMLLQLRAYGESG